MTVPPKERSEPSGAGRNGARPWPSRSRRAPRRSPTPRRPPSTRPAMGSGLLSAPRHAQLLPRLLEQVLQRRLRRQPREDRAHGVRSELAVALELLLAVELVGGGLVREAGMEPGVVEDVHRLGAVQRG